MQVSSTESVITREYRYCDVYGMHVVTVRGFNLANNDTASTTVDVLEWNCSTPNISVDPSFNDENAPFMALTDEGFTVSVDITIDCMKNEEFNVRWEILDAANEVILTTSANGSELVSAPNALPAGAYVIRINVTMWSSFFDLSDKTAVAYGYVNLERCESPNITVDPLFASAEYPYTALPDTSFTVAVDYSFDCEILQQFNISWDVLDSAQERTLITVPNATQITISANDLSVGSYVIRINATMWSGLLDLSHKAAAAYAYANIGSNCQPPNVTLDPFSGLNDPFIAFDDVGFTVTADFVLDCPPMEELNAQWDLLDSSLLSVLRTVPNATEFVSLPYDLSVGVYAVRVNTTIWSSSRDLSDKTTISLTYINVTRSALFAGIDGSSYINATFNSTVYLSAYNLTYVSNQPSDDKSGMDFEWRCKRSTETWPAQMSEQSYMPHSGTHGGCFDDVGPGVLGFAAELWSFTFDTSYLEPLIEYDIEFVVSKDLQSATAAVSLYVQRPLAPSMSVRSVYIAMWRDRIRFESISFHFLRGLPIYNKIK